MGFECLEGYREGGQCSSNPKAHLPVDATSSKVKLKRKLGTVCARKRRVTHIDYNTSENRLRL